MEAHMADDSQRAKARAAFGSTFFDNSKAVAPPKNFATAQQKVANSRPIPTFKVGGPVKKAEGGLPGVRKDSVAFRAALNDLPNVPVTGMRPAPGGGLKTGGKVQTSSDTARKLGKEMGGFKKGGKVFEGSPKDEAQDRMLAKKYGISMKKWEKSKMDAKHDRQESTKGLKDGGVEKKSLGGVLKSMSPLAMAMSKRGRRGLKKFSPAAMIMGKSRSEPASAGPTSMARPVAGMASAASAAGGRATPVSAADRAKLTGAFTSFQDPTAPGYGDVARQDLMIDQYRRGEMDPESGAAKAMAAAGLKDGGKAGRYAAGGAGKVRKGQAPIKRAQGGPAKTGTKKDAEYGDYVLANRRSIRNMPAKTGTKKDAEYGDYMLAGKKPPVKRAQGGAAKVRKGMMTPKGQITPGCKPSKGLGGL
jgi:hypothetical protein